MQRSCVPVSGRRLTHPPGSRRGGSFHCAGKRSCRSKRLGWLGTRLSVLRPDRVDFCLSGFGFENEKCGHCLRERRQAGSDHQRLFAFGHSKVCSPGRSDHRSPRRCRHPLDMATWPRFHSCIGPVRQPSHDGRSLQAAGIARSVSYPIVQRPDGSFDIAVTRASGWTHYREGLSTQTDVDIAVNLLRHLMAACGAPLIEEPLFRDAAE